MQKRLIIFSGLPGTGKTALARRAAGQLGIPLLAIDDITTAIPPHMSRHADPYWDDMIHILLALTEVQLEAGLSVIVDSVFMGADRAKAEALAARQNALYPQFTPLCPTKTSGRRGSTGAWRDGRKTSPPPGPGSRSSARISGPGRRAALCS